MALNANCVANVTTTGNDNNAGWFDTSSGDAAGGANDRAFSNSPIVIDGATITASVHTTTTQATLVGHTLASTDRGNVLRISGGTATAGYYRITSVDTANNRVTVDASMGASGATITGRIGGAFASPGFACSTMAGGTALNIKEGTYTITTATTNVANGCLNPPMGNSNGAPGTFTLIRGYALAYGDGGRPTLKLQAGVSSAKIIDFKFMNGYITARDIICDGSAQTNSQGFGIDASNRGVFRIINCKAIDCTTGFADMGCHRIWCEAISCTTGFGVATSHHCVARQCGIGFQNGTNLSCIAHGCTTSGFNANNPVWCWFDCVAVGNLIGYQMETGGALRQSTIALNCIGWGNTNQNFKTETNRDDFFAIIFSGGGGSADVFPTAGRQMIINTTLTANPFVNAAGGDFSLNDVAGGGATLKALNFALPGISTTRYPFGGWAAPKSGGCPLVGHGGLVY